MFYWRTRLDSTPMYDSHICIERAFPNTPDPLIAFISIRFLCEVHVFIWPQTAQCSNLELHFSLYFPFATFEVASFLFVFKPFSFCFFFCSCFFQIAKSQGMLSLGLCMRSNVRQGERLLWSSICGYCTAKSKLNLMLLSNKKLISISNYLNICFLFTTALVRHV